ncbi:hypothetical protein ISF_03650 [Cordyceps fumosorosea ARSEF 2679]|uniref:Centrosomin N-terminal motif 1 domain-containing protein n=1 Tax=Cordyceps fumosorosea (strain ARSEF 2679) TaxID=1081104 RepID=A0A167ZG33_CORFA|nr:hypothetical protein ISF_03650 [Cordyceps fumosorosea ARSEF 2679]OAA67474.1 hypothetical protein ISF_03650 [Cordyceps fumosorosea ARSEF 2679]
MDPSLSQPGQRPRPPYPRAPSRASTIASNTRSVSSSNTSHMQPASPAQSFSHPQRFHCTATAASPRSSSRATPQLSREASGDLARPPTMSTFLQEKLQKERRAESEKLGSSTSSRHNLDLSASVDLGRVATDRSFRSSDHEPQRPQSSTGMESGKKKGLGLKEMEQVVSSLHKQNFDLKLELYHRRERQTKMEERLEALEAEKQVSQKLTDKLLADLDKRDKAIEEAVSMIVELEAKVDQLLNERTMVQHVESQGFYASTDGFDDYNDSTANSSTGDLAPLPDRSKTPTVTRMPSFLSDRKPTTENLRNIYVGNRASVMSLRCVSGGHSEADNAMVNGLASPTLSVLSESSFISVYGQKGDTTVVPDFDEPIALSGFDGSSPVVVQESPPKSHVNNNHLLAGKYQQEYRPATVQPVRDLLTQNSPRQRRERSNSEARPTAADTATHHIVRSEASHIQHCNNSVHGSPARRSMKDEKRAALRKVVTDAGGVRLHDQALPPTPDTISSSTLQRYKNSNENLSVRHQTSNERQRIPSNETRQARETQSAEQSGGVSLMQKEAPRNVRSSRPDTGAMPSYDLYGAKNIPRPRSAGDTTVSHKRKNSWDSDDSDTKSLQSSLDIWMRESTNPQRTTGRVSPDLFGFPTSMANGGWAASSLFDPKQRLGAMPSTDYMHDLLSLREALLSPNLPPPPPPDRRSSLHGHVGRSASAMPTTEKPLAAEGTWQPPPPSDVAAAARNRRNSDAVDLRSSTRTPVQGEHKRGNSNASQHPPISWQQGPRAGLKGLFRRSLPGNGGPPAAASPAKAESSPGTQETDTPSTAAGWAPRSSAGANDCDRTGATPPPIMLNNPRQAARRSSAATATSYEGGGGGGGAVVSPDAQSLPAADAISQHSIPHSQSTTGGRRKWLPGFSRNKA